MSAEATLPVGQKEIATKLKVQPQSVRTWLQRGVLPPAKWTVSGRPAWDWADIKRWAKETGRLK